MEVRDSVHVKTTVSERIGTEIRTTEQQMSANEAFEETQAAVEQRAKQYKRRHKAAVDSLSADSLSGNLPLQFKPNVQDTVSQKQQVAKLKTLFANDSLSGTNMQSYKIGVAGDPVPYSLASDNLVTGLMIGCFILVILSVAQSQRFIVKQTKNLFLASFGGDMSITETAGELRFQFLMSIQTCLLLALLFFFYTNTYIAQTFILEQYQIIGIFAGVISLYFCLKGLLYQLVNSVFFDKRQTAKWLQSFLFIIAIEGLLLLPIVLLCSYFHLSMHSTFIYTGFVLLLFKFISFYNSYLIFFRQKGLFLQIFLYFCTLEIIPLSTLWGVLQMISNYLKINF